MPDSPPLQEGLHAVQDGVPRLLANRCDACERVFFPRRSFCARCCSPTLRDIALSHQGALLAWSLIERQPALAVVPCPYIQAEVAMPEGVHVFTVLDVPNVSDLQVDMPVEVFLDTVPAPGGQEGRRIAYKFRPVSVMGGSA